VTDDPKDDACRLLIEAYEVDDAETYNAILRLAYESACIALGVSSQQSAAAQPPAPENRTVSEAELSVEVLMTSKPPETTLFGIPVGRKVSTRRGNGIVTEICAMVSKSQTTETGYIVKMDESETSHHGVKLFFTHREVAICRNQ
jgi:hypothetical protein